MSDLPTVGQTVFVYNDNGLGAKLAVVKSVGERCLVVFGDGTADHVPSHRIVPMAATESQFYDY